MQVRDFRRDVPEIDNVNGTDLRDILAPIKYAHFLSAAHIDQISRLCTSVESVERLIERLRTIHIIYSFMYLFLMGVMFMVAVVDIYPWFENQLACAMFLFCIVSAITSAPALINLYERRLARVIVNLDNIIEQETRLCATIARMGAVASCYASAA